VYQNGYRNNKSIIFAYNLKNDSMIVVSGREFRANQGKYIDMVVDGRDLVLKFRGKGSFKIVPVSEDDTLMSKEEFYAKIDHSIKQVAEGKVTRQHDGESVKEFIDRLLCTD
jgi:antitoxin (DNA-binding transcriptional repressor) of toxin-antitoxin stability system